MFSNKKVEELEKQISTLITTIRDVRDEGRTEIDMLKRQFIKFLEGKTLTSAEISQGYNYGEIDQEEFERVMTTDPGCSILDVRTLTEWNSGHIENAIHIELAELEEEINQLSSHRNKDIFVICAAGGRSAAASDLLATKGFNPINVQGGMNAFRGPTVQESFS